MRLRLLAVLSALLLLAGLPAGALSLDDPLGDEHAAGGSAEPLEDGEDEPEIQVCSGSQELLLADGFSGEVETPSMITGDGETFLTFRLDLQAPAGSRAAVDVGISWGVPTNDYDLAVNGETSVGLQPLDAPEESVTVTVGNCGLVSIRVYEFVAPVVIDTIELDIAVRPLA